MKGIRTMQALHAVTDTPPREAPGPGPCAGPFDRYRPAALLDLFRHQPLEVVFEQFPPVLWLVLQALPDFHGDEADVLAMVDNSWLRAADSAAAPVEPAELDRAFPALAVLGEGMVLDATERLLLAFLVTLQEDPWWDTLSTATRPVKPARFALAVAAALRLAPHQVRRALHPGGSLSRCGLLDCRPAFRMGNAALNDHVRIQPDIDLAVLRDPRLWATTFDAWFGRRAVDDPRVTFPHLEDDLGLLCELLEHAMNSGARGTHVLLYGPPGTGKTTLAVHLAQRLGASLFEVPRQQACPAQERGETRLRRYDLGQRLGFGDRRCLMLFDELEDLLPAGMPGRTEASSEYKGWICESLEQARIPTFWTTNSLTGIEPAILRRFTFTLEVGVPPRTVRRRLLDEALQGQDMDTAWLERIARLDCLTPAMTVQLAALAASLPLRGPRLETALDRWLEARLAAMNRKLPPATAARRFRCELLNVDTPPDRLARGLARASEGRLCLYGPPGSGKTAFANHLAERLDLPALVKRGSDLRSCWVGETERNIARMFAEATREGAVLILDEADSFLSTRSDRNQRWEMNETTEFLVQLEGFRGIFCATTNRFEDLDPAFLRRFDLKVRFDYLNPAQREVFFRDVMRESGLPVRLRARTKERLASLDQLTPGDYVAARRGLQFSGQEVSQDALLSALVHEVACKNVSKGRPIGFRWES
jgi:SpoVK/Ycf46/Vps4 family AAA+-type ATPase